MGNTRGRDDNLQELLDSVSETIQQIFKESGNVGGSVGILDNEKSYFLNLGQKELPNPGIPDRDTLYLISSMTKPFLGLAMAILINEKENETTFDTTVSDIFPELRAKTSLRHELDNKELTVAHLLAHRSEFQKTTNLWECPSGQIPWKTIDPILSLLQHLPQHDKYQNPGCFHQSRNYSNECFALLASVIERVSGVPWGRFVTERVLQPLGMSRTFTGVTEAHSKTSQNNFAGTYSVRVDKSLEVITAKCGDGPTYQEILEHLTGINTPTLPDPVSVTPSQASFLDSNNQQTILGAAAGMTSCVSDLMKFYAAFLRSYATRDLPRHGLTEIEHGMAALWDHILKSTEDSSGSIYSGGCVLFFRNTTLIPWTPLQKSRWPGADGDNVRRLQSVPVSSVSGAEEWYFFQSPSRPDDKDEKRNLALYHGGNMIGATSFCFLTVVILCNTRGFFLDAANLVGMFLADALDRNLAEAPAGAEEILSYCEKVKILARQITASYLFDLVRYERDLSTRYPEVAHATQLTGCVGRYQLVKGVFADVVMRKEDGGLRFQLYGTGLQYPLRVRKRDDLDEDDGVLKVSFAMSMRDLVPHGVGGNNRMDVGDFELAFRGKDEMTGRWREFVWVFDRAGAPSNGDVSAFVWERLGGL
ncbi:beta-lactamase/transpeptidase-like protein [Cladorrhinum sp. PSN259]|nr:beta-lactamase/transpeptidase-like protein [Cladorrhinum sp. PSN259]